MPTKRQLSFFATQDDLIGVLEVIATKYSYSFVKSNNRDDEPPSIFTSVSDLCDLSISVFGDQNKEESFLLIASGVKPSIRKVEQRTGGNKIFFDQLSHPESVALRPGGIFGNSNCIISGQLGTITSEKWSIDLYEMLLSEFKEQFIKIKSYYVGKIAAKKLDDGVRLTTNVKAPQEYDLQRSKK